MTVAFPPPRRLTRVLLCGVATLLAASLYINALWNPFVFDDVRTVVDNGTIASLRDVAALVQHEVTRPLTNVSFAIDRALWGTAPFGFHLTNVLLHALNTVLVFLLALRVCGRRVGPGRDDAGERAATVAASVTALLFAAHPVVSEAVGYISSRADLLCATFFLTACLCGFLWLEDGRRTLAAMWAAWCLALLTKETAVVFPIVLMATLAGGRANTVHERRDPARLIVWLIGVMMVAALARASVFFVVEHGTLDVGRAVSAAVAQFWTYLRLIVLPAGQSIFHPVVPMTGVADPRWWWSAAALAVLTWCAWQARGRVGPAGLGVAFFLVTLAPALFVAGSGGDVVAEHRAYLPAVGVFLVIGSLAASAVPVVRRYRSTRLLAPLALASLVLMLGGRTYIRNMVWSDPVTLWQEAVRLSPAHWLPHAVLGESLHAAGRHDEAVVEFRRSLALRPDNDGAMLNAVVCLTELQREREADALVLDYETRHVDAAAAAIGRGTIAMLAGRRDEARLQFLRALERDPHSAMARQWLAIVAEQDADLGQMLNQCYELQRLTPGRASVDACIERMLTLQGQHAGR